MQHIICPFKVVSTNFTYFLCYIVVIIILFSLLFCIFVKFYFCSREYLDVIISIIIFVILFFFSIPRCSFQLQMTLQHFITHATFLNSIQLKPIYDKHYQYKFGNESQCTINKKKIRIFSGKKSYVVNAPITYCSVTVFVYMPMRLQYIKYTIIYQ